MNKPLRLKKALAALLVAGVALPALFQSAPMRAQDAAETEKINLMVAALTAKDNGDLADAKAKTEQLLRLAPEDTGAKDLLAEINQAIGAKDAGGANAPAAVVSAPARAAASAQNSVETEKANLAIAALEAKNSGDLTQARIKAEQLVALAPDDAASRDLLNDINQAIYARNNAATPNVQPLSPDTPAIAGVVPAPVPAKPLTALDRATQKSEALYSEVQSAMVDAVDMAKSGNTAGALKLIDNATEALNKHADNIGSQDLISRLQLLRQEITAGANTPGGSEAIEREASRAVDQLARENARRKAEALLLVDEARSQIRNGQLDEAQATLDKATKDLPRNISTVDAQDEIRKAQSQLIAYRFENALQARDISEADRQLASYGNLNGKGDKGYLQLSEELAEKKLDPTYIPIDTVSRGYADKEGSLDQLIRNGKAQYLYGDYQGALRTFAEVSQYQPNNTTAQAYSIHIRNILAKANQNQSETRARMLGAINDGWLLPNTTMERTTDTNVVVENVDPITAKLKKIKIPTITLRDAPLSRAVETLSELSRIYDPESAGGVNMIPIDPDRKNPIVTISLRDMSLDKVLDTICKIVNFSWSVNNGIVEVRAESGTGGDTETEFFEINPQAVIKMTGIGASGGAAQSKGSDLFGGGGGGTAIGGGDRPEEGALKSFFQRSGISFDIPGSNLAYDGTENLTVTQTRRNIEKIRNLLRRYSDIKSKQYNIETKFLEVTQGALKQLSSNFVLTSGTGDNAKIAQTSLRTLNDAFGSKQVTAGGKIVVPEYTADPITGLVATTGSTTIDVPNPPPAIPRSTSAGSSLPTFEGSIGHLGNYDVKMLLTAIEENEGSDLMAAPNLTVTEDMEGTITIAQKLRYPTSYNDPQLQTGGGGGSNNNGTSSASVGYAAGTPQDFDEKDIGVKLVINAKSMSKDGSLVQLKLNPTVTEFEGFVEYGGASVAISNGTVVTVPSGFYQPVFSVRQVDTTVTILDGSTVVFGGLTREEVKTVNDKVPVLGDLPLIGSFFQSNGRSSSKRNLMIFVTANLVGPGGGLVRQTVDGIPANSTYANPTVLSPGGQVYRGVPDQMTPKASAQPR